MLRLRLFSTTIRVSTLIVACAWFSPRSFAADSAAAPVIAPSAAVSSSTTSTNGPAAWYGTAWTHMKDTWKEGGLELYAPFYTLHMPYAYTPALLRSYNDIPYGLGIGKGRINKNGNWEGMFALEFADSHSRPEYEGGYAWIAMWHPFANNFRAGAGVAGVITARSDIMRYTPFPGAVPLGSVGFLNFDVQCTFIPGGKNDGNVLFSWIKVSFY